MHTLKANPKPLPTKHQNKTLKYQYGDRKNEVMYFTLNILINNHKLPSSMNTPIYLPRAHQLNLCYIFHGCHQLSIPNDAHTTTHQYTTTHTPIPNDAAQSPTINTHAHTMTLRRTHH